MNAMFFVALLLGQAGEASADEMTYRELLDYSIAVQPHDWGKAQRMRDAAAKMAVTDEEKVLLEIYPPMHRQAIERIVVKYEALVGINRAEELSRLRQADRNGKKYVSTAPEFPIKVDRNLYVHVATMVSEWKNRVSEDLYRRLERVLVHLRMDRPKEEVVTRTTLKSV